MIRPPDPAYMPVSYYWKGKCIDDMSMDELREAYIDLYRRIAEMGGKVFYD